MFMGKCHIFISNDELYWYPAQESNLQPSVPETDTLSN